MSFAAPIFLWLLAAVPVVVVLHFLRTRRTRVNVSALFLWTRAKELARQRRRFDRSWLLALQIAAVVATALALARPQLGVPATPDRVLVIDASASMAARHASPAAAGASRLDDAVAQAETFVRGGGRIALVRAGLEATVEHPLDTDRSALRDALARLRAGDRDADLARALALARSVAPGGEIHLFGDVAPAPAEATRVAFHPIAAEPEPARNVGITSFDLGLDQAFVAVASNAARPSEIEVVLERDGVRVASSTLLVPVGRTATATFPLERDGIYAARIATPADDALPADDVAYAGRTPLRVALLAPSPSLERALGAVPGTTLRFGGLPAQADVHVLFGTRALDPTSLPPGRYLAFAEFQPEAEGATVQDWERNDPLLRFVDLRGATVGLAPAWSAPPGDGWTTLATSSDLRPVLLRWRGDGRDVVFAAFHPAQTDMVYRPAFPTLIANVLTEFGRRDPLPLGAALPAGTTRLVFDDGSDAATEVEAGARALAPGIYRVEGQLRPVSLLARAETRLPVPPAAAADAESQLADTVAPASDVEGATLRRDLALALVGLALAALLGEWLLYTGGLGRRVDRWRRDAPRWPRWMVRLGRRVGLG